MRSTLYPVQDLHRRVLAWALKLKVNPRVVRVRAMRHKWGSCSSAGTVTLAIDLLDQDARFQDYVIVHELLHLRYATHGRVFTALMNAYVPRWREMEKQRRTSRLNRGG
jgi:predicted metal-dependent hydrolase